jgi:phosphopantothenoylcysteine decarboxylase/phosphopantothenate--cysteine ligase
MSLENLKFLVTAGPTIEAIDPVRFISNHSTGKMGYAIAGELAARGAEVTLISGSTYLPVPEGVRRIDVVSAEDMYRETTALWGEVDGAVMCAAVADYTPVQVSPTKIKKQGGDEMTLTLKPTKDIAAALGRTKRKGQLLVGFALETDHEEQNARRKLEAKGLDFIVLNSLADEGAGFGGDTNRIAIIDRSGTRTDYPLASKSATATAIVDFLDERRETRDERKQPAQSKSHSEPSTAGASSPTEAGKSPAGRCRKAQGGN